MNYKRTIDELKTKAINFWSEELLIEASKKSKIPILLQTQDQFLNIIKVEVDSVDNFFKIVEAAKISINLFVQHLMVLSNVGGEFLQRINGNYATLFPSKSITFTWRGANYVYKFSALPLKHLGNTTLNIDGENLFKKQPLTPLYKDVIILMLFGSSCTMDETSTILEECQIGGLIGNDVELEKFVRQRYIQVSRITGGAKANDLGQIAQTKLMDYMTAKLKELNLTFRTNGHVPEIYNKEEDGVKTLTTFDLVINNAEKTKYVVIELTFQVTTNSTIERKSGQAMERYKQVDAKGYKIAYVIDGAGNFQRTAAISKICSYSHCNVAYTEAEFDVLIEFISSYIKS
ncbi:MAG: hypothetical protein JW830_14205 [Bacteroidales bacterium]|nr:hypothetical protein [Bacteroidales bacterium]